MRNITKALLGAAALAMIAVGTTGCSVPEDDGTTHAEEVVKEQAAVADEPVDAPVEAPAEPPAEPQYTVSQENAIAKAVDYLDFSAFSESGLADQLEFEGFSAEDAAFAVDHVTVDWNAQAAAKAMDYLDTSSFSRSGLIDQLVFEGFTPEQATYGVDQTGL
jgi:colicin import membrane protein